MRKLAALALMGVGACGGGDGGAGTAPAPNSFTATITNTAADALGGARTDHPGGATTAASAARTTGLTGAAVELTFAGETVGTFRTAALAENTLGDTLTLSLDAGQVLEIATLNAGDLTNGDYLGILFDPILTDGTVSDDIVTLSAFGAGGAERLLFAVVGLETPLANLPGGTATYTGEMGLFAVNPVTETADALAVDAQADVNFALGALDGTFRQSGTGVGAFTGALSGTGVTGTLTLNDAQMLSGETLVEGEGSFVGLFFGVSAEALSGVVLGEGRSTSNGGQQEALAGGFALTR